MVTGGAARLVGAVVYHASPCARIAESLGEVATAFAGLGGGPPACYDTWTPLGARSRSPKPLGPESLPKLRDALVLGRYHRLDLYGGQRPVLPGLSWDGAGLPSLFLGCQPDSLDRNQTAAFPYSALIMGPWPGESSGAPFHDGVLDIARALGSPYVHFEVGEHYSAVMALLALMQITGPEDTDRAAVEVRRQEIRRVSRVRFRLGERVRGPAAGMALGPQLVEALGGMSSVTASAPVDRVRPWGTGGVFLEADGLLRGDDAVRARLAEFLGPITA